MKYINYKVIRKVTKSYLEVLERSVLASSKQEAEEIVNAQFKKERNEKNYGISSDTKVTNELLSQDENIEIVDPNEN